MRVFTKKTDAEKLAEARKLIEDAEKLETEVKKQQEVTPIIDTAASHKQPTPTEIKEIEEQAKYYQDNYRGIFNPTETPAVTTAPMDAEIASLLFGVLQELRKIKEKLN